MKTTIAGIAGALLVVFQQIYQAGRSIDDWKTYIVPAVIAVLGVLAKDSTPTKSE